MKERPGCLVPLIRPNYYDNYREISCGPHGFTPDLHCETSGEFQVALARNRPGDRCRHATPSCSSQPLGLIGGPEPGNAGEVFPAFTGIGPKWERHHTTPSSAFGSVQDQSQPSAKFRLQLFEPRGINQPNIQKIAEMGAVPVPKGCQLHPDQRRLKPAPTTVEEPVNCSEQKVSRCSGKW